MGVFMKRSRKCEAKVRMLDDNQLAGVTGGGDAPTASAKMELGFKNNASTHFVGSWADQK
jgi:hypothetical protein